MADNAALRTRLGQVSAVDSPAVANIALIALTRGRQIDRANANPGSIGSDFKSFDLDIWEKARELDKRTQARQRTLEQLNIWRNAIAHQDFDFTAHQREMLGHRTRVGLTEARAFRCACDQLAISVDNVLARHLAPIVGERPW